MTFTIAEIKRAVDACGCGWARSAAKWAGYDAFCCPKAIKAAAAAKR